jgi:LPPG:FO 2-phospho-L-lactate transferase
MTHSQRDGRQSVLALSGGVGGAKLAWGLARILNPADLTVVANTGDDFEHLGFHICPDIDTLMYTLAGLNNETVGWGRRDETWSFMDSLRELGGETWFKMGDRDLALHVERTSRLRSGESLSSITSRVARSLGIASHIVPMTNDRVRTQVSTPEGVLDFQRYFVEAQCRPHVSGLAFTGAEEARPNPQIVTMLKSRDLRAIVICPSNPFISIDPILAMPALRAALAARTAPVIAVSPIIGGKAVKGPTAKMMSGFGLAVDPRSVAAHYAGVIDGFVIDTTDSDFAPQIEVPTVARRILMTNERDREDLARAVVDFADDLACQALATPGGQH